MPLRPTPSASTFPTRRPAFGRTHSLDPDVGPYSPRFLDSLQGLDSACMDCRHYDWTRLRRCQAFPESIPTEIWLGDHRHLTPFPGDAGLRFDPTGPRP